MKHLKPFQPRVTSITISALYDTLTGVSFRSHDDTKYFKPINPDQAFQTLPAKGGFIITLHQLRSKHAKPFQSRVASFHCHYIASSGALVVVMIS